MHSPPVAPARAGRRGAFASLALAMVTVGTIAPASKLIAEGLPPFLAGALRLALAAAVLVPWAAARHRGARRERLDAHDRALLALQAAGGTVGFTVLMLLGTARTSAVDASVVTGTLPAVAALLSAALLGERAGPRRTLGVALAVGAVAVVGAGGSPATCWSSARW
jgi:drug/metabolite transporter (DMT)-like permease